MDSKTMIRQLTLVLLLGMFSLTGWAMTSLDDSALSNITGQALIQMSQITGTGTSGTTGTGSSGLTFYRLGFDGSIDLNANINKVRLGCGGINGAGGCDISINQLSISGNGCANRALNCDAVMTNPYIELAIANNNSPTTRSLEGFRVSAQNMSGLLSFGQNGPTPSGINTFSGYMTTTPITGTATTMATNIGGRTDPQHTQLQFYVNVTSTAFFGIPIDLGTTLATSNPSTSPGIDIPSMSVPFSAPNGATINGNRQTLTSVTTIAPIPTINLGNGSGSGTLTQNPATGNAELLTNLNPCLALVVCTAKAYTQGYISGLQADIGFQENLGYIHNVVVNSPFYLSFEQRALQWPGAVAADVAQRGWWMSFADPVNVGTLNPVQQIDISPTFQQMAGIFLNYFNQNSPINVTLGFAATFNALFNQPIKVNVGSQNIAASVTMQLANLQLDSHQNVVPNCMGNYKFC